MSLVYTALKPTGLSFPRVSGDEPPRPHYPTIDAAFSPRERG